MGWVGVVTSKAKVNDGQWHHVAVDWEAKSGAVELFVDGKKSGAGTLAPKGMVEDHVLRIGRTAEAFPDPSYFRGKLDDVRFYSRKLSPDEIAQVAETRRPGNRPLAQWRSADAEKSTWASVDGPARCRNGRNRIPSDAAATGLTSFVSNELEHPGWRIDGPNLRLIIPASNAPQQFTLFQFRHGRETDFAGPVDKLTQIRTPEPATVHAWRTETLATSIDDANGSR